MNVHIVSGQYPHGESHGEYRDVLLKESKEDPVARIIARRGSR